MKLSKSISEYETFIIDIKDRLEEIDVITCLAGKSEEEMLNLVQSAIEAIVSLLEGVLKGKLLTVNTSEDEAPREAYKRNRVYTYLSRAQEHLFKSK